jgi:hypothetical protein
LEAKSAGRAVPMDDHLDKLDVHLLFLTCSCIGIYLNLAFRT